MVNSLSFRYLPISGCLPRPQVAEDNTEFRFLSPLPRVVGMCHTTAYQVRDPGLCKTDLYSQPVFV